MLYSHVLLIENFGQVTEQVFLNNINIASNFSDCEFILK